MPPPRHRSEAACGFPCGLGRGAVRLTLLEGELPHFPFTGTARACRQECGPCGVVHAGNTAVVAATGELRYSAVEGGFRRLLSGHGPARATTPAYPFHHLVSDEVWEVRTDRGPGSPGSGVTALRTSGAAGRLAPELRAALRREPSLLGRMTRVLLDLRFPPSPARVSWHAEQVFRGSPRPGGGV